MRIEWLEAFQKTVETKSFTKASEQLHMSQPALSKQIRSLESYFGCQLFVRSASGVVLTKEGELLIKAGNEIVERVQKAHRELAELNEEKQVVIGSWPSIASSFLPQKFRQSENFKAEKISIKTSHTFSDLMTGLKENVYDGILMDDRFVEHHFLSELLFIEPIMLYFHKDHPLAEKKEVTFSDIEGASFLSLPEGCDCRIIIEKAFEEKGKPYNVASEIEFGQSILGFISANLGIALLPKLFSGMISPEIRAVEIRDIALNRHISLISNNKETGKIIKNYLKD
ncbi:LysR family transcriptional regulator [Metabacillus indicus]|uniref:LysR family transcriptional regulator n=1 Tax=Metabacillus indicus TaxID=246786 RepID=UPI002A061BCF|nr:LysR family transcriptional regulator [Metabacillus indicus]MDX8291550.1 LysR family transcriptional regulator [Metabacillus indicus]